MAHFSQMNGSTVVRVIVVHNNDAPTEADGIAFCRALYGQNTDWIQCSYNGNRRKQYPAPGYTYDAVRDGFVAPRPFPSWTLDANNDWQPPTPKPDDEHWLWDEANQEWTVP